MKNLKIFDFISSLVACHDLTNDIHGRLPRHLEQLKQDCRNPHDANTILLAFTSRHLRKRHRFLAGTATDVKHGLEVLSSSLDTDTPPPSALSVLCRRIGGICIFCSNRARHSREIVTNLQICQACKARKLAKISGVNLNRLYDGGNGLSRERRAASLHDD